MLAIAKACSQGELAAEVVLVASNRPDSAGIEAAGKLGLNTAIIDHKSYEARSDFEAALTQCLQKVEPILAKPATLRVCVIEIIERKHVESILSLTWGA